MRKMVCIRRCHGFRGGTWDEGEIVDAADGEDVPRHFIPYENYEDYKAGIYKARPKNDPMRPAPQSFPQANLPINKGGMTTVKGQKNVQMVTAGQVNRAGEDI